MGNIEFIWLVILIRMWKCVYFMLVIYKTWSKSYMIRIYLKGLSIIIIGNYKK